RRDVVDRLPEAFVQEPLERGLLDVDEVGEVEDVLDLGKGLTRAGQSDLGGQRKSLPWGRASSGEFRRAEVRADGTSAQPARIPEETPSRQAWPNGRRRKCAAQCSSGPGFAQARAGPWAVGRS